MAFLAARNEKVESPALSEETTMGTVPQGCRRRAGNSNKSRVRFRSMAAVGSAVVAMTALALAAPSARASTSGNDGGLAGPVEILNAMGIPLQFSFTSTNAFYGYIRNDYIGVVVGLGGGTVSNKGQGTFLGSTTADLTHNSGGMIAFGNQQGSLIYDTDNTQALAGLNEGEDYVSGKPIGWGVWPLPGWWQLGTDVIDFDYSAYVRAQIDGATNVNIVGSDSANTLIKPRFVNGVLQMQYLLSTATGTGGGIGGGTGSTAGIVLDQEIRLYRATAQLHWVIRNNDSVAHQVTLRFTVPIRQVRSRQGFTIPHAGFIFQDPTRGGIPSNLSAVISGNDLPDTMTFYGKRYEADDITDPPYSSRFKFRTNGASLPTKVYVSDTTEMRPNAAGFEPRFDSPTLSAGATVGVYYGPYTVQPGSTQDVYSYYGNGQPSENQQEDVVVGAESTESVGYNSAAANDATILGTNNGGNTAIVGSASSVLNARRKFLTPNPFSIYGDVFNRKIQSTLFNVNLTNVNMSLVLPTGLSFATNPNTTQTDVAARPIGTVTGDTDVVSRWYVQADGDPTGLLTYQVSVSANETGARTITRGVTVPVTPLYQLADGYQMIGVPFQLDPVVSNNGDPQTVINALTPQGNRDQVTLFNQWIPDPQDPTGNNGHYAVVSSIQRGFGYYYQPNTARVIYAAGVTPSANQADASVTNPTANANGQLQITLERGWNMISNPYVYQIPISYLRLVNIEQGDVGGPATGSQTFAEAVSSGLVQGTLYHWDPLNKTYDAADDVRQSTLDPWNAYFVKVTNRIALVYSLPTQHNSVIQPAPDGTIPPTRAKKPGSLFDTTRSLATANSGTDWKLHLMALRSDGKGDRAAIIGVSRSAKTNDALLPKPPVPQGGYVDMQLTNGKTGGRYAQVLKSPTSGGNQTWDMQLRSDSDGPVTLLWPNLQSISKRVVLKLKDNATGGVVALRSRSSFQVNLKKGETRSFQLIASEQKTVPLSITTIRTHSIGGSGGRSAGVFEFAFGVTQDAEITGQVTSLTGKEVTRLSSGRAVTAGNTNLKWDGRAANGAAIAPGSYIIKIMARNSEGEMVANSAVFTSLR